jgi:hypothetical protein
MLISNLTQTTTRLAALYAGFLFGPVIAPAQTLVAWGDNSSGQINVPSGTYTAVGAGLPRASERTANRGGLTSSESAPVGTLLRRNRRRQSAAQCGVGSTMLKPGT